MVNGSAKFGYPDKRTRPRDDENEQKAWDDFKKCIEDEIQIILNLCARK